VGEIWRLAALTVAILTSIVAFAAGVRPLANGQLEPADALRFMGLALIPMLQFTAPFAAGFAATLAYHRLTTDNEDAALSSAGISRRALLGPATVTGLAIGLLVAALAQFAIPLMLRAMQELVTRDAARVLIGAVERGSAAQFGGFVIHADRAIRGQADPARGVTDRLFLFGVVAYDEAPDGSIRADVAAERAEVLLTRERRESDGEPVTVVRMLLEGAVGRRRGEALGEVGAVTIGPWIVPNAFRDSPRLYTFFGLRALKTKPEMHPAVDILRRSLARELARDQAERFITSALDGEGRVAFTDGRAGRVVVWASGVDRAGPTLRLRAPAHGPIVVERTGPDGDRTLEAEAGSVSLTTDPVRRGVRADLVFERIRNRGDALPPRARIELTGVTVANPAATDYAALSSRTLRSRADSALSANADDTRVRAARDDLAGRITHLNGEILASHHERFALAVSCIIITLLGATLALRLRDRGPLQVYLWSLFPALAAVVTISGGKNAVPDNQGVGLTVLWGGLAVLAAVWVNQARRLSGPLLR